MARASAGAGRTAAPLRSRTRILLPAPFMRAIARPASGWRETKPSVPLHGSAALRPGKARRPVDRPRAEPGDRLAQVLVLDSRGGGARGGLSRIGRDRRDAALVLERRQRALAEGDLVDAAPAEMGVHPGDDDRGAVLRLERECALDPEHQRRGLRRRFGVASGGPRRPLELDRAGVAGEGLADDRRPVRDQARFAEAARGQRLREQPGGEFSQPLGADGARASSWLEHGAGIRSHGRQCKRARREGKAKGDCRAHAALVGSPSPGACLARRPRRGARSLPGVALRSAAAADDRPGGDALLSGLHRTMAAGRGPGRRFARGRDRRVRRPRLLFAGAQPPRLRTGNRSPRRAISERGGGPRRPARRRRLYRRRDRGDRLRAKGRAGRRQHRPRPRADARARSADRASERRHRGGGAGARAKPSEPAISPRP